MSPQFPLLCDETVTDPAAARKIDFRPYKRVTVLEKPFKALADSGAVRFIGARFLKNVA